MGSSSNGLKTIEIRYAPYIEVAWVGLLDTVSLTGRGDKYTNVVVENLEYNQNTNEYETVKSIETIKEHVTTGLNEQSPYSGYVNQEVDEAFFGSAYVVSSFASLYEMFGAYMAGFDLELLWDTEFSNQMNATEITGAVRASVDLVDDDITKLSIPEFKLKMRENNSVISSSFVVGKANIERERVKGVSKISASAKFKVLQDNLSKHWSYLNWQKGVVTQYAEALKLYYMTASQGNEVNTTFAARNYLWPFEVLDFERATYGTMRQQAGYQKTGLVRKRSAVSTVLSIMSTTVTGAIIGAQCGGYVGAIVGAIVGFIIGVAQMVSE